MNKEYIYIDGKVVISDKDGKHKAEEYYDNIDDVLIQENKIETMESRIAKLEKDSQFYKKNNRKHYIPFGLPMFAFMSTVGVNLLIYFLSGTNPLMSSMNTIFGVVNKGVLYSLFFSTFFIPMGALLEVSQYYENKEQKGKEKGTNSELEFLKKQIVEEKQKLEDLKKEKTRDEEDKEFRVVEVDDKQQLNDLESYLNFYFDLGYNEEKYFRYYQQGRLDKKLRKYYTDRDIEIAKEYLEEKGPTLVKRKSDNQNSI